MLIIIELLAAWYQIAKSMSAQASLINGYSVIHMQLFSFAAIRAFTPKIALSVAAYHVMISPISDPVD
jgi:hypothetical protein